MLKLKPHRVLLPLTLRRVRLFPPTDFSTRLLSRLAITVVLVSLVLLLVTPAPALADITYIYDALGRLRAVVDTASNDTAIYSYDAVGNLLSITRQSATVVSIIEFTPSSGPVGTTVTIYGTGFSATATEDTVSFNGTTAAVVSATATQIVATVPAGATTGPITVTAPAGSATSSAAFTVGAPGAPTITSFSPTIGTPGTAVTITGTNFDILANDRVIFNTNVTRSVVTSATASTIGTSVPSPVGSGRITVATPNGQALSNGDFYVPPAPYAAADVAVTNRITVGTSTTVTLSAANKIALLIFDGTAGQRINLGVTNVTLGTSACCGFYVYLRKPDGTPLTSALFGTNGGVFDPPALPSTGTYTISVEPQGTNTGSVTLTFSPEITGSLVVDGASFPLSLTQPGQNARLTFVGTVGQRLSLAMTNATLTSLQVSILNPDGSTLVAPGFPVFSGGAAVWDLPPLPTSGTYTAFFDPYILNAGAMTLLLSAEVTGSISVDGAPVTVSIPRQGQRARFTFTGTAGQRVNLGLTGATIGTGCCSFYTYLLKPDGTTLSSALFGTSGGVLDPPVLPVTGTYAILVDPQVTNTGNVTLTLSGEVGGSLVVDGASFPLSLTRPGQNARLTFVGTVGQRLSLAMTNATLTNLQVSILNPDGSTLVAPGFPVFSGGAAVWDLPPLPTSGTYTAFFDPYILNTGAMTLLLSAEVTGSISVDGAPATVSIPRQGQRARFTFDGTASQWLGLGITGATIGTGCCTFYTTILKPDGTTLLSTLFGTSGGAMDPTALPTSGSYALLVDPQNVNTGNVTLTLSQDTSSTLTVGDPAVPVSITRAGQNARLTFGGTASSQVTVRLTSNTLGCPTVTLFKPDGTSLTSTASCASAFNLATQTLPVTGTYTVKVDPGIPTGGISVAVTSP